MFISPAYAQSAGGGDGGLGAILPLILIFVVFYFFLIRPQQKRQKEHKAMLAAVRRKDKIITSGGVYGTVTKVINDEECEVEIADNVTVKVRRDMIAMVLTKPDPTTAAAANSNQKSGGFLGGLFGGGKKDPAPAANDGADAKSDDAGDKPAEASEDKK